MVEENKNGQVTSQRKGINAKAALIISLATVILAAVTVYINLKGSPERNPSDSTRIRDSINKNTLDTSSHILSDDERDTIPITGTDMPDVNQFQQEALRLKTRLISSVESFIKAGGDQSKAEIKALFQGGQVQLNVLYKGQAKNYGWETLDGFPKNLSQVIITKIVYGRVEIENERELLLMDSLGQNISKPYITF